ncbi:MAG: hypothetical protein JF616_22740 [Fibrobacteres bacterium]|nr:hypothetical protein [Fibrobacterota bacterium]
MERISANLNSAVPSHETPSAVPPGIFRKSGRRSAAPKNVQLDLKVGIRDIRSQLEICGVFEGFLAMLKGTKADQARNMGAAPMTNEWNSRLERVVSNGDKSFRSWHLHGFVLPFIRYLRSYQERTGRFPFKKPHVETLYETIVQHGLDEAESLRPMQEVMNDLYDGFLSEEDRKAAGGINPPDPHFLPPLAKWDDGGEPPFPFTVDKEAIAIYGVKSTVISMPRAFSGGCIFGWASVAHETCGHAILGAYPGLHLELKSQVKNSLAHDLKGLGRAEALSQYWEEKFEEGVSDALAVLNLGPAMAIGFIGAFRGQRGGYLAANGFSRKNERLSAKPGEGPHPSDFFRVHLLVAMVGNLRFSGKEYWMRALRAEIEKDFPGGLDIGFGDMLVSKKLARVSAETFSRVLATSPMESLGGHALGKLQNWNDSDETNVSEVREMLRDGIPAGMEMKRSLYAAHALAAAITQQASRDNRTPKEMIFQRLMQILNGLAGQSKYLSTFTQPLPRSHNAGTKENKRVQTDDFHEKGYEASSFAKAIHR